MGTVHFSVLWRCLLLSAWLGTSFGAPPNRSPQEPQKNDAAPPPAHQQAPPEQASQQEPPPQRPLYEFAYSRYLEQVVKILENDPKFTEKLKTMPETDIKSGKIADHLDDLGPHVFEQLTKAKLAEIERLREVIAKQINADGGAHNIKVPEHLDVNDWEKFTKEDLRKLIQKTVADMDEIDRQRREEFKEYEMKKQAEADHKMANMSTDEREKFKQGVEDQQKRHNEHEKVKHPGGRDQLEEVWEESDKMEKDNFDPKTFFALHDLNGDGLWSAEELEALFQLELQKVYNDSNPDDDPRERIEEMYRMREHVVQQMDKNKDRMISLEEFLADAEAQEDNNNKEDEGWKDLGDQPVYSPEELKKFEEEYARQQGWGDYAYSTPVPTAAPAPVPRREEQPPVGNALPQQQVPVQRVPVAPQQPAAQSAVHSQPVPNAVPLHQGDLKPQVPAAQPLSNDIEKTYGL